MKRARENGYNKNPGRSGKKFKSYFVGQDYDSYGGGGGKRSFDTRGGFRPVPKKERTFNYKATYGVAGSGTSFAKRSSGGPAEPHTPFELKDFLDFNTNALDVVGKGGNAQVVRSTDIGVGTATDLSKVQCVLLTFPVPRSQRGGGLVTLLRRLSQTWSVCVDSHFSGVDNKFFMVGAREAYPTHPDKFHFHIVVSFSKVPLNWDFGAMFNLVNPGFYSGKAMSADEKRKIIPIHIRYISNPRKAVAYICKTNTKREVSENLQFVPAPAESQSFVTWVNESVLIYGHLYSPYTVGDALTNAKLSPASSGSNYLIPGKNFQKTENKLKISSLLDKQFSFNW
jgi:hypothetical protein